MCMNQSSVHAEERAAALLDAEVITLQMRIATLKAKADALRNGHPAPDRNARDAWHNPLGGGQGQYRSDLLGTSTSMGQLGTANSQLGTTAMGANAINEVR